MLDSKPEHTPLDASYAILNVVTTSTSILTEEFAQAAPDAGLRARREALSSCHFVVFMDGAGRLVKELPDGRLFEVCFELGVPRESHLKVLGEIAPVGPTSPIK